MTVSASLSNMYRSAYVDNIAWTGTLLFKSGICHTTRASVAHPLHHSRAIICDSSWSTSHVSGLFENISLQVMLLDKPVSADGRH